MAGDTELFLTEKDIEVCEDEFHSEVYKLSLQDNMGNRSVLFEVNFLNRHNIQFPEDASILELCGHQWVSCRPL